MSRQMILAIYGTTDINVIVLYTCIAFFLGCGVAVIQRKWMKR